MTVSAKQADNKAVIVIDGNIDSAGGHELSVKLMDVMEWENITEAEFDMTTVNTVTSSAIGKLINFFKFMEQKSGKMKITSISDSLKRQFKEIHLDRIIPIA